MAHHHFDMHSGGAHIHHWFAVPVDLWLLNFYRHGLVADHLLEYHSLHRLVVSVCL
jgi:hypothetical protein